MLWDAKYEREHYTSGYKRAHFFHFVFLFWASTVRFIPLVLAPSTIASPFRTTVMHWANQSYNAGCIMRIATSVAQQYDNSDARIWCSCKFSNTGMGATAVVNKTALCLSYDNISDRFSFPCLCWVRGVQI